MRTQLLAALTLATVLVACSRTAAPPQEAEAPTLDETSWTDKTEPFDEAD